MPGQKVKITVNRVPSLAGAKTYEIEPLRNDRAPALHCAG